LSTLLLGLDGLGLLPVAMELASNCAFSHTNVPLWILRMVMTLDETDRRDYCDALPKGDRCFHAEASPLHSGFLRFWNAKAFLRGSRESYCCELRAQLLGVELVDSANNLTVVRYHVSISVHWEEKKRLVEIKVTIETISHNLN
jgi:hypothetical protein